MTEKKKEKLKTVNIKGKDYVEVNTRIIEFRTNETYKGFRLISEIIDLSNGAVTMKATVLNDKGEIIATGHAQEKESSSYINKTSLIENCETSAWGRALGNLGIGIDTSIASYEEVQNAIENQEQEKAKAVTETKDVDVAIFKGLQNCQTIDGLKAYYQKNYNKVKDKQAFVELKNARKTTLEGV